MCVVLSGHERMHLEFDRYLRTQSQGLVRMHPDGRSHRGHAFCLGYRSFFYPTSSFLVVVHGKQRGRGGLGRRGDDDSFGARANARPSSWLIFATFLVV